MKSYIFNRLGQRSTWLGIATLAAAALSAEGSAVSCVVAAITAGLGLIHIDEHGKEDL